ncbi:MAG: hypothetical protein ACK41Y_11370 [Paracoccus hibiscisoli]
MTAPPDWRIGRSRCGRGGGQWPSDNYPVLAQVVSGAARCAQP